MCQIVTYNRLAVRGHNCNKARWCSCERPEHRCITHGSPSRYVSVLLSVKGTSESPQSSVVLHSHAHHEYCINTFPTICSLGALATAASALSMQRESLPRIDLPTAAALYYVQ